MLIPLLFMGDIVGRLFREFAITLSVTILVSAVVSLTLTPMMCSRLLRHKPESEQGRLFHASERVFESIIEFYGRTLAVGPETSDGHADRRRSERSSSRFCFISSSPRDFSRCRTPASFREFRRRRNPFRFPPWPHGSGSLPK